MYDHGIITCLNCIILLRRGIEIHNISYPPPAFYNGVQQPTAAWLGKLSTEV